MLQELPQESRGLLKSISQGLHCTSVCAECIPENTKPRPAASSLVVTHSLINQLVTSGSLHKSSADFGFPFLNKDCSESFTRPRSPLASLGGRRHFFFAAAGQGNPHHVLRQYLCILHWRILLYRRKKSYFQDPLVRRARQEGDGATPWTGFGASWHLWAKWEPQCPTPHESHQYLLRKHPLTALWTSSYMNQKSSWSTEIVRKTWQSPTSTNSFLGDHWSPIK